MEKKTINSQQLALLSGLKELLEERDLIDVTLVVDGVKFPCHRNILAASSPYFRAMFTTDVRESAQSTISIHGISKESLELVIIFIYTGLITLTNENIQAVITAANMFQLDGLLELCVQHMSEEICLDNCFDVYCYADYQCLPNLKSEAKQFVAEHFTEIFASEDNLNIDKEVMIDIISSDDLLIENELQVFDIIINWVNYKLDDRKKDFSKLFSKLRLALIDQGVLRSVVLEHPFVRGDPFCKAMISVAKLYHLAQSTEPSSQEGSSFDINTTKRRGMNQTQMLLFPHDSSHYPSFCAFDPETKNTYTMPEQQSPEWQATSIDKISSYKLAVTRQCNIYFLGGKCGQPVDSSTNAVFRYVSTKKLLRACQSMNASRCEFAVSVLLDTIYVFGGLTVCQDDSTPIDLVECYNTEDDYWQVLSPMPIGIYNHAASARGDDIFIFGGVDNERQYLNTVLQYSTRLDRWTLVSTELFNPRAECSAIFSNDKFYILGGRNKYHCTIDNEVYDPIRNTWEYAASFPEERKSLAVVALDDSIYVFGGIVTTQPTLRRISRTRILRDLHKYSIAQNEWTLVTRLVPNASINGCAVAMVDVLGLQEMAIISP